ncbi:MAG: hypothetical protein ACLU6W_14170 [Lachnospiraceae bacterium]
MRLTQEDKELFRQACERGNQSVKNRDGIGTLKEKTVHAVLKHYIEPREQYHEVPCGNFVADILAEGEITEIQTAHFHLLRKKLEQYLEQYEVTVVYPIPHQKWMYWIDPDTGELSGPRKSPKKGSVYDCFRELYRIKPYLNHPKLHVRIVLMDMEEYRYLDGWSRNKKKGSTRAERYPKELWEDWMFSGAEDYAALIPEGLKQPFTSLDFAREAGIRRPTAQSALNILRYLDVVRVVGKEGRSILYQRLGV